MNANRAWIEDAMEQELENSLIIYPYANIPHGSAGVIEEEIGEAAESFDALLEKFEKLKKEVRKSKGYPHQMSTTEKLLLDSMKLDVIHMIEECIQIGAMIEKYKKSYDHSTL